MTAVTKTLNQIVSAEKQIKSRVYGEITNIDRMLQKPDLLNGLSRKYQPKDENGETFPEENKRVQIVAKDTFQTVQKLLTESFDLEATKDATNGQARADITVGETVIAASVPATTLLFLEKQLNDLHTLVARTPVLDPSEVWTFDNHAGVYKSETTQTHRTKKVQKPVVLYHATPEHPAQTVMITEDEIVGHWHATKHSGALRLDEKARLLERINVLAVAVKHAREKANGVTIVEQKIGAGVLAFLFN